MRDKIWRLVGRVVPEGAMLPWWALALRAMLYPVQFICWRAGLQNGYQFDSDTWRIHGVTYSGAALWQLAHADGETYRIKRVGDVVNLERVER